MQHSPLILRSERIKPPMSSMLLSIFRRRIRSGYMIADHFQPVNRPIRPVWLVAAWTTGVIHHFGRLTTAVSNFLPVASY